MVLAHLATQHRRADEPEDHDLIELINAAFEHRADCGQGAALLSEPLRIDPARAARRNGPRAYLHTAGVAAADADGMVVSSLISVFDDFGSAVFVPQAGIVLNNRAAGFTTGANAAAPATRPVHTLAPALITANGESALALATPGADGQVQTLLQVLTALNITPQAPSRPNIQPITGLGDALAAPRWRSENGSLLIEADHRQRERLASLGHDVQDRIAGDEVFGSVVAAGIDHDARPFAAADWRRNSSSGAV